MFGLKFFADVFKQQVLPPFIDESLPKSVEEAAKDGSLQLEKLEDKYVNAKNDNGERLIHICKRTELIKGLIARGADVNATTNNLGLSGNCTPLHSFFTTEPITGAIFHSLRKKIGAKWDNFETVEALLAAGADPNLQDVRGWTFLHYVVEYADDIKLLKTVFANTKVPIQKDLKTNQSMMGFNGGETALLFAARNNKTEMFLALLEQDYDLEATNQLGLSSLHYLIQNANVTALNLLLKNHRAQVETLLRRRSSIGENLFHFIALFEKDDGQFANFFVNYVRHISPQLLNDLLIQQDQDGCTPAQLASNKANVEILNCFQAANKVAIQADNTKQTIYKSSENLVLVRVWLSDPSKPSVGHVTVQTNKIYSSLWPTEDPDLDNILKVFNHKFLNNPLEDEVGEGTRENPKPADITIPLYSLDIGALEAEFERLRKECSCWVIQGSTCLAKPGMENCCSSSFKLLQAGGIGKLLADFFIAPRIDNAGRNLHRDIANAPLTAFLRVPIKQQLSMVSAAFSASGNLFESSLFNAIKLIPMTLLF